MLKLLWSTIKIVFGIFILLFLYVTFFDDSSSSTSTKTYEPFDDSSSSTSTKTYEPIEVKKSEDELLVEELENQDCAEFIQLLSAKQIAREFDRTEMWALQNYKVIVWEKTTTNGKGKKVGEMHCGSRALILERNGDDFKIKSPKDESIGWVNSIQVDKTLYQSPDTYEKCKK